MQLEHQYLYYTEEEIAAWEAQRRSVAPAMEEDAAWEEAAVRAQKQSAMQAAFCRIFGMAPIAESPHEGGAAGASAARDKMFLFFRAVEDSHSECQNRDEGAD